MSTNWGLSFAGSSATFSCICPINNKVDFLFTGRLSEQWPCVLWTTPLRVGHQTDHKIIENYSLRLISEGLLLIFHICEFYNTSCYLSVGLPNPKCGTLPKSWGRWVLWSAHSHQQLCCRLCTTLAWFWPGYSSLLLADDAVIGIRDWSCSVRDK